MTRDFKKSKKSPQQSPLVNPRAKTTKGKKKGGITHANLAKGGGQKDLSLLLKQDAEHQEDQLGLNKQGSHGRYGPYTLKDVLEFKTFFDFFSKEGTNIIELDHNPAFLQNPYANQVLESFKQRGITGRKTLAMEEFMEIVFCFAKYEERRRMVHLIDLFDLAAKIKEDFDREEESGGGGGGSADRKESGASGFGASPPVPHPRRSAGGGGGGGSSFLSKEVLHEIELHFRALERDDVGAPTVRELHEALLQRGALPPRARPYAAFEDLAKEVVYEGNKKALGKKEWAIFWRQVERDDLRQRGLGFREAMGLLRRLKKLGGRPLPPGTGRRGSRRPSHPQQLPGGGVGQI